MNDPSADLRVTVRSEFAMVELSLVPTPSGPILRIDDQTSGLSTTLDAIELEGLCWLAPDERQILLAPPTRYGVGRPPTTASNDRS